jgi:hypothetical protein
MTSTKFTATLSDETVETRTSKTKTYTHVVVGTVTQAGADERTAQAARETNGGWYTDHPLAVGEQCVYSWSSRPDLADKEAARLQRQLGTLCTFSVQPVD